MIVSIQEEITNAPSNLGKVIEVIRDNKKTIIIREYGIEKFTNAIDPSRCKIETLLESQRRILNLRQAKYLMQRRKKLEREFGGTYEIK
jgi:spermidine synthase